MIKKIAYFLPPVAIMSIIFYLSSGSTGIGGTRVEQFFIHKTLHIFVYASLSASFYFAFTKTTSKTAKQIFTLSIFLTYLYGISDEIHQSFVPGREAKFTDTLFDLFGAIIGIWIYGQFKKQKKVNF